MAKSNYEKLHSLSKNISLMNSIHMLLDWDQETFMPKESIHLRSQQSEMMASLVHKQKTSKKFSKSLSTLIDLKSGKIIEKNLSQAQQAALREWRHDYLQAIKLPNSFVKAFAKVTSTATHTWQTAREQNDFNLFAPHLEKVVEMSRKKADILGFKDHPYDALLDLYEPDMTTATLTPLFAQLKTSLSHLIKKISNKKPFADEFLYRPCSKTKQMDFAHQILDKMGFDLASSRLDISFHPFCTCLHPKDTRMTTRVHPDNLMLNLGAVLHEGGHGLYGMHRPYEEFGTPLAEPVSFGIDESQSRWWETLIGQSYPFWEYFYPRLQEQFPESFAAIPLEDFYRAINQVQPGFIRIDADEVTYNLHIIIRFEIEKGLMEGTLKVQEIPEVWNSKMKDYLDITPESDSKGCLQDIHWSLGYIGYFPSYTLGNLYAAQFFQAFEKAHSDWKERVARGELSYVQEWLKNQIHKYGRQYSAAELCARITEQELTDKPYIDYLTNKYTKLYQL